jgi:hypothetical protein
MLTMDSNHKSVTKPRNRLLSIVQGLGAAAVTLGVLWFLFGVPAVLLFEVFF